jgi:hypothetical protein
MGANLRLNIGVEKAKGAKEAEEAELQRVRGKEQGARSRELFR